MGEAKSSEQAPTVIPDKLYFKIGEVAEIIGVKPYVLRYWETEFPEIAPSKSKSKQRLYKRKEVEQVVLIRDLLYREKFTIEGARQRLKEMGKRGRPKDKTKQGQISLPLGGNPDMKPVLRQIKQQLQELVKILEK